MRIVITLFLLLILNAAKAEVVSPTFKSSKSLVGVVNDPSDVDFSPDGTKIFISGFSGLNIKQFTVTTPFDISTIDTSSEVRLNLDGGSDDVGTFVQGHAFNNDGTKVFVIQQSGKLNIHKDYSIHPRVDPPRQRKLNLIVMKKILRY